MTSTPLTQDEQIDQLGRYKYGWADADVAGASARRGINEDVVTDISRRKGEPEWMLERRLKALKLFGKKPMPDWGSDLSGIDFQNIKYFVKLDRGAGRDLGGPARGHQEHLRQARHPRGGEAAPRLRCRGPVRVRGRLPQDP